MNLKKMAMKTVAGAALLATMFGCGTSEQKNVSNDSARVDSTALIKKETDSLNQAMTHYITMGMDDIKVDTTTGVVIIKGEIITDDPTTAVLRDTTGFEDNIGKNLTLTLGLKDENQQAIKSHEGRNARLNAFHIGMSALPEYNDNSMTLETNFLMNKREYLNLKIVADKKSPPKSLLKMIENLNPTEDGIVNTRYELKFDK